AISKLNLTDRLGGIAIPTLIVVGADDPATTVEMSRTINERIGGSELVILKNAAHLSNMEQADAFNEAALGFLPRPSPRGGWRPAGEAWRPGESRRAVAGAGLRRPSSAQVVEGGERVGPDDVEEFVDGDRLVRRAHTGRRTAIDIGGHARRAPEAAVRAA